MAYWKGATKSQKGIWSIHGTILTATTESRKGHRKKCGSLALARCLSKNSKGRGAQIAVMVVDHSKESRVPVKVGEGGGGAQGKGAKLGNRTGIAVWEVDTTRPLRGSHDLRT